MTTSRNRYKQIKNKLTVLIFSLLNFQSNFFIQLFSIFKRCPLYIYIHFFLQIVEDLHFVAHVLDRLLLIIFFSVFVFGILYYGFKVFFYITPTLLNYYKLHSDFFSHLFKKNFQCDTKIKFQIYRFSSRGEFSLFLITIKLAEPVPSKSA